jgi:hypothetical protein
VPEACGAGLLTCQADRCPITVRTLSGLSVRLDRRPGEGQVGLRVLGVPEGVAHDEP